MYRVTHERKYDIPNEVGAAKTPDGALALIIAYCEDYHYHPSVRIWNKFNSTDTIVVDVAAEDDWFLIVNEEGNVSEEEFHIPAGYSFEGLTLPEESLEDFERPF